MKHRILALAMTVCLCLALTPTAFAQWVPPDDAPEAAAVYLENLDTGTVLYERNADEQRPIASLTKMMTCLLLAESGLDLDETFAAPEELSPEFARIRSENGAYIDLQPGEEVTLRDLAYCTMLPSTNDSASTIAWRVAGSLDAFVAQMNDRAAQLGCTDTRYSCPHGLYDAGNYSTAHDLARIAEACMNNDVLRTICTTREWWLPLDNVHQTVLTPDAPAGKYLRIGTSIQLQNPDSPFYRPWAEGVKTGFTDAAGRCVVTTAHTDTGRYLLVLLGEPNRKLENGSQQIYQDAAALLDWAVGAFSIGSAPDTEQPAAAVPLRWCEESSEVILYPAAALDGLLLCSDTPYTLEDVNLPEQLEAPVAAGQQVGQANLVQNGEVLGTVPLEVRQDYVRGNRLYYGDRLAPYRGWLCAAGALLVLLLLVTAALALRRKRHKHRRAARRR